MPIYLSWFITALLFGKWWPQQSQPTAKVGAFYIACKRLVTTTYFLMRASRPCYSELPVRSENGASVNQAHKLFLLIFCLTLFAQTVQAAPERTKGISMHMLPKRVAD